MNQRRLNGRDILAKTFPAKSKKGYDPIDVDAYLELVASQVDILHDDIALAGGLGGEQPEGLLTEDAITDIEVVEADEARMAELEEANADLEAAAELLRAENDQLRTQLTLVAPPPPVGAGAATVDAEAEATEIVATEVVTDSEEVSVVASPSHALVVDDRASEESYEIVLRAAQRSVEEAIAEAHNRADEIVGEATLTASRIAQESDRKAYEAATRAQGQLAAITTDIENQENVLANVTSETDDVRSELRRLGERIVLFADQDDDVLDLRESDKEAGTKAHAMPDDASLS